jgi:hypothetical protein
MPRTCAACSREGHIISHDVVDPARRLALRPASGEMVWSPDVLWDPMNPRSPDAEEVDRFCEICGSPVLTMCESCGAAITRGPLIDVRPGPFCRTAAGRMAGQRGRRRSITSMISWLPSGGFPRLIVKDCIRRSMSWPNPIRWTRASCTNVSGGQSLS